MKEVELKKIWVDDENHFLKGYIVNELKIQKISWIKFLFKKIKILIKNI
jgi:hypothetical protein